jgi:multiple sugar transport system ATP-binding protein
MNLIRGRLDSGNMFVGKNGKTLMQLREKAVSVLKRNEGRDIYLGIRPENITEAASGDASGISAVNVTVTGIEHLGSEILLYGNLEDDTVIARLAPDSRLNPGSSAALHLNLGNALFFDADTEEVIM